MYVLCKHERYTPNVPIIQSRGDCRIRTSPFLTVPARSHDTIFVLCFCDDTSVFSRLLLLVSVSRNASKLERPCCARGARVFLRDPSAWHAPRGSFFFCHAQATMAVTAVGMPVAESKDGGEKFDSRP